MSANASWGEEISLVAVAYERRLLHGEFEKLAAKDHAKRTGLRQCYMLCITVRSSGNTAQNFGPSNRIKRQTIPAKAVDTFHFTKPNETRNS